MRYKNAKIEEIDPNIKDILNKNAVKTTDTVYRLGNPEPTTYVKIVGFNKGIMLYGTTGTGKTYTLNAIYNATEKRHIDTYIGNWTDMLIDFKSNFDYLHENIRMVLQNEVIIIDDVGAEKHSDWSQEMIYTIVNRAYERAKTLFIATNLSLEQFREKYGDRIFSRLNEMCDIVELAGEDRRFNNT